MSAQELQLFKLFERNALIAIIIVMLLGFATVGGFLAVVYKEQTAYATKFTDNLIIAIDKLRDEIKESNKTNAELRVELVNLRINNHAATTTPK